MLPPVFSITPEILRLIAELDEFKGQWRMIRSLSPEKLTSLRKVATIESVGSSTRIEGSKLTDRQVEDLLGRLHITEFKTRDEQEVAGYAYVMDQVFDAFEQIPVTENMIGQLHQDLLRHSTKDERHRGHYKTLPNNVAAFDADGKEIGIVFQTTSPFDTPREMESLVAWFIKADRERVLVIVDPLPGPSTTTHLMLMACDAVVVPFDGTRESCSALRLFLHLVPSWLEHYKPVLRSHRPRIVVFVLATRPEPERVALAEEIASRLFPSASVVVGPVAALLAHIGGI